MFLFHPEVPSCEECKRWAHDPRTWKVMTSPSPDGKTRRPIPLRVYGGKTPCGSCPKVPEDDPVKVPHPEAELTDKNILAFLHYRRCRAVGKFPEDSIVERNAAIIRSLEDACDAARASRPLEAFLARIGLR